MRIAIRIAGTGCMVIAGLLFAIPASAARLQSPWDAVRVAATDAPYTCPAPPRFSQSLRLEGYYSDSRYSVIDPKRLSAFNEASAGPTHLGQFASRTADAWLSTGSRAAAQCVYSLLTKAAKAGAWSAEMPSNNGVYLQNWVLSGTAIAYLKVRNSGAGSREQDAQIQNWFRALAGRVRSYFDRQRTRPGSDAWNNHLYWAGLSVMAEGIADGDADAFAWGVAAYRMGLYAIEPDGSLDAEMARGQKALHYQLYALAALVMMAELGEANGIPMYAMRNGAIHRLVRFDTAALENPAMLSGRAGVAQEDSRPYSGNEIGWAAPYLKRFPNAKLLRLISRAPWVSFWQWGGDPPPGSGRPEKTRAEMSLHRTVRKMLAVQFPDRSQSAGFFGAWCTEGNAAWSSLIRDAGDTVVLRNESGSTSIAETRGSRIAASTWNVVGQLSEDRRRIDWNNGTFWSKCSANH